MTAEVLEDGSDQVLCELTEILSNVWECVIVLLDWMKSLIVPVYKKADKSCCDDHESFDLTNMLSSIFYHPVHIITSSWSAVISHVWKLPHLTTYIIESTTDTIR